MSIIKIPRHKFARAYVEARYDFFGEPANRRGERVAAPPAGNCVHPDDPNGASIPIIPIPSPRHQNRHNANFRVCWLTNTEMPVTLEFHHR
jgi:hypothetical protein